MGRTSKLRAPVVSPNIVTIAIRILFSGGTNSNQKSLYYVNLLTTEGFGYLLLNLQTFKTEPTR